MYNALRIINILINGTECVLNMEYDQTWPPLETHDWRKHHFKHASYKHVDDFNKNLEAWNLTININK